MADPSAAYLALRGAGAVVDARREVLRVAGPEATAFLQGQLSQDLAPVAPGGSVWSWVLQPAGKVDALVRVSRAGDDEWLVDTDEGWAAHVATRLGRFKLRTKADIELLDGWRVLGVRGRAAPTPGSTVAGAAVTVDAGWSALPGTDLIGPDAQAPPGLPVVAPAEWEAARVEAGIPVMGAELTERTIPAETGLVERTVSFTKGCYTGQELVARIDSRGSNVPRHLCGFRLAGPAGVGPLHHTDGSDAGVLTSVADSPRLGWIGLGYVRRTVADGSELVAGGAVAVTVVGLPMIDAAGS